MIFRDCNGKLINIDKYSFTTDTDFYKKICNIKNIKLANMPKHTTSNIIYLLKKPF